MTLTTLPYAVLWSARTKMRASAYMSLKLNAAGLLRIACSKRALAELRQLHGFSST